MPSLSLVMMMMMPMMFLSLRESKSGRFIVIVQERKDNSQEGSKSEAYNETDLDVIILGWIIRELPLCVAC
jgi:hypothetical protein